MRRRRKGGEQTEDLAGMLSADAPAGADDAAEPDTAMESDAVKPDPAVQGWRRVLQGNRVLWVLAAVAIVSLVAGVALSFVIVSPGQAAADAAAPEPGLITVPIEKRELSNDVTIRGDAAYADSVEVKIETGDLGGPAVVTGRVPEAGATFDPASVALEVTGRPVIVLPGELPAYRTLRAGLAGPDVTQLKQALHSLGIDAGDLSSNVFDSATAAGVAALYDRIGYPSPDSPEGTAESVRGAREGVRSAEEGVAAAQRELDRARTGPTNAERIAQDNVVRSAERDLAAAKALPAEENPDKAQRIADAEDALRLARAQRDEALAPRDASDAEAAVNAARGQLDAAYDMLAEAQTGTLAFLPASEVLYLSELPRRVDEVMVERGTILQSAAMLVSGATLTINASAAESDAKLLSEGMKAVFTLPDDSELSATIGSVKKREAGGGSDSGPRYDVVLVPDEPTAEQVQMLRGENVRVRIAIGATEGSVLAVPLAALTAGPGGESRVEVVDGEDTRLVEVTTGLAAEGFVEIEGDIAEGELVVVGR